MNIFQGKLQLQYIQDVAHETKVFRFSIAQHTPLIPGGSAKFGYRPGQFLSIKFTDTAWRAYSISSCPGEELLEFVIRHVPEGTASEILWKTKVGDQFDFKGPFGELKLSENKDAHLVFCATGTGIAPFRSMIREENKKPHPRKMTLLYGGRNTEDLAYREELPQWSDHLQVQLGLSREEGTDINLPWEKCRITKFLEDQEWEKDAEFYICGNGSMVKSVNEILESKNIPKEKIFMERFN